MKEIIQNNLLVDTSQAIDEAVKARFGKGIHREHITAQTAVVARYDGMRPYKRNPDITVVPAWRNMTMLAAIGGNPEAAFGINIDGVVRPAIITRRSTPTCLDIAYLTPPADLVGSDKDFDRINPQSPLINPNWPLFLLKAVAVQDEQVGGSHESGKPMGNELGHSVQATVALKHPGLLSAGHLVEGWTSSPGGIEGTVNNKYNLYDFNIDGQVRPFGVSTMEVTASDPVPLLKIPELDSAMAELAGQGVTGAELAVGVGVVAARSFTGETAQQLQDKLLVTMEGL